MDIGKVIGELMDARGITLSDLTRLLGYQSKTSIVRVMKNQASARALDGFAKRVGDNLKLTDAEQRRFAEALEHMRWQEDYASSREMLKFLRGETDACEEVWLEDAQAQARMPFSQRYLDAEKLSVTLLNSQYVAVFPHLLKLVRERGARVEHFLQVHEEPLRVIHAINALIPLIYERNYAGYSYREGAVAEHEGAQGLLPADVMVIQYVREGQAREDMIAFDRQDHGFLQSCAQPGAFLKMLGVRRADFLPIKRSYLERQGFESYVQYSRDYAQLEYNRAVYKIKPDIGIDWIDADVSLQSLLEGGIPGIAEMTEIVDAFRQIYRDRVRNTFQKRRVAKTIMKRGAMVRFARTGRTTDHFWGMRPFTPDERLRILRQLLDQMENNPYFYVYFLRDNDFLRDVEIAYYEGLGVLVLDSDTDYELEKSHSEVMIVHGEFMRMFKEYFERALISEQVLSRRESLDFMNELIRMAACEG